jgi:hypothetical protein
LLILEKNQIFLPGDWKNPWTRWTADGGYPEARFGKETTEDSLLSHFNHQNNY